MVIDFFSNYSIFVHFVVRSSTACVYIRFLKDKENQTDDVEASKTHVSYMMNLVLQG